METSTTIKLVAFDLDGTLTESKMNMTSEMGELLAQLLERLPVAVMSGAAFHQFENQFLAFMPLNAKLERLYLFPTNAARCYVFRDGKWKMQYDESFTDAERTKILSALDAALVEVNFPKPEHIWGEQTEDRGSQITFSALGQLAPIQEKSKWDPTREKRRPLYDALVRRLPEFSIGLNATTSIDITRKGITKAYGIQKLSEISCLPIAEMLYAGDALYPEGNDAVVIESGVQTHAVINASDTAQLIKNIIAEKEITLSNKNICD